MRLIKTETSDGLELDGIYCGPSVSSKAVIVHIHGKCGNFYQNSFIQKMAEMYPQSGYSFLSMNNRGHDCVAEAYSNGGLVYVGGSLEGFEFSVRDIEAMIKVATELSGNDRVILQGHSFGCDKVVRFIQTRRPYEFILLSPADSRPLIEGFAGIPIESLARQLESKAPELDLTYGSQFYGVRAKNTSYAIPISQYALVDALRPGVVDTFSLDSHLGIYDRAVIYVGTRDSLVTVPTGIWIDRLKRMMPRATFIVRDGDHHFHGLEEDVVSSVIEWIASSNGE